jgi:pantoate--beta-alanine ligase
MQIFKQIAPLKAFLKGLKCKGKTIGLVPTMGALHAGHVSLIKASKLENDITLSSIFVNPIQFNNQNDLLKYPRSIEKDIEMLQTVGCDILFNPDDGEMYPQKASLTMDFGALDKSMEGKFRPGHFSGVALIVAKLFNIVEPDNAYFGQKDWQQYAIIQKLIQELNFQIRLHSVPTLREEDGLALSSRNQRLNTRQREHANVFYKSLLHARAQLRNGRPISDIKAEIQSMVDGKPDVRLEYLELVDSENLNPLENVSQSKHPILCIAGYIGEVRLIDNMFVE